MSHQPLHDSAATVAARTVAVRASLAGDALQTRLTDGAQRRLDRLRDDGERGSQTAEYAMVGGVGAAAAGALVACIKNTELIESVLRAVVSMLVDTVKRWF